jgi:hypothetical protein
MTINFLPFPAALLLACMLSAAPLHAATGLTRVPAAPASASRPVLVINSKGKAPVNLDLAALARLPQHSFRTNSPWTKTPQTYSGPLLRDVLALAGVRGTSIKAQALNEYQVTIPVEDAHTHNMIIAQQIEGKPIPVRERGPLFIIYPFDSKAELQESRYYDRSIWQLMSLQVD